MPRRAIGKSGTIQLLLLGALIISGCGDSLRMLNKLAASGSIHQDAPVTAHLHIEIAAPPSCVWALLIDAPSWPAWAHQIESVSSSGPLTYGKSFTWKSGGTTIHSQVQLFEPERRLSWTGTALTAKAIHVWQLAPGPDGGTTVTVNESMDGPLMKALYPSEKLSEADMDWLSALKKAAEEKP